MRLRGAAVLFVAALLTVSSRLPAGENRWTPASALPRVLSISGDGQYPGFLYALTNAGIFRSDDLGESWVLVNPDLRPDRVGILAADPVLAGRITATGCGVLQSDDFGVRWTSITRNLPPECSFTILALDPNRPYYIFTGGTSGFFRTDFDNAGPFWSPIAQNVFAAPAVLAISSSVFFVPSRVYSAPRAGGFFYSDDRGTTWTATSGPPGARINGLTVFDAASNPGRAFVIAETDQGLYQTRDAGSIWERPVNALEGIAVNSLLLSDRAGRASYAATSHGIRRDIGEGWEAFSEGIPDGVPMGTVFSDPAGRHLCALSASGDQVFNYRYGLPTISPQNPQVTILVNAYLQLQFAVFPPQPGDLGLDLESSDPASVEVPTRIYPSPFRGSGGFGVSLHKATGLPVTIRARVPKDLGGSDATWTVVVLNPPSTAKSTSPTSVIAGSPGFRLRVFDSEAGRSFVEGSTIKWNGSPRKTAIGGPDVCPLGCPVWLETEIDSTDIVAPGYARITVENPAPGGGTSAPMTLTIEPGVARQPVTRGGTPSRKTRVVRP